MDNYDNGQVIQEDASEPSHFAMIPKMAMIDLSPYELALYCQYKMTAREHGKCWKSNKTLADETGMSKRQLQDARAALVSKGYITLQHERDEKGNIHKPPIVTIVNIWAQNRERYTEKTTSPLAPDATPHAQGATPLAPDATKEYVLEEKALKKSTRSKREGTIPAAQINPMKDAIVSAFGWQWETMTKPEKGLVQITAKELCTVHFDPARVGGLYVWCRAKFPHITPRALSTHVSEYCTTRLSNDIAQEDKPPAPPVIWYTPDISQPLPREDTQEDIPF